MTDIITGVLISP